MEYVLIAIASVLVGAAGAALAVYSVSRRKIGALERQHMAEAQARVLAEERSARLPALETQIAGLQQECSALKAERAALLTRLEEQEKAGKEKLALLDEARQKLSDAFKALSQEALKSNSTQFLELARTNLDKYQEGAKSELEKRQKAIDELVKPLKESLTKVDDKLGLIEKARAAGFATLTQQINSLATSEAELKKETANLTTALREPRGRGRWGEIQLRRIVELAGMLSNCDFVEQKSASTETGRTRPDMIIRLPDDRNIVVDAKVSLQAYLEALEAKDDSVKNQKLKDHARQVRMHIGNLATKNYWEQFQPAPEFVVLFLAGEVFFSAALEQDLGLIEYGVRQKVILAGPTTLVSILSGVAYSWQQQRIAQNAQAVNDLGKKLYDRIRTLVGHFDAIGKNLDRATEAYNAAVGSMERSVLVSARKFKELGAGGGPEFDVPRTLDARARTLQGPETNTADPPGATPDVPPASGPA